MSRFTDALDLQLLENAWGDAILTADGRCQWTVQAPLTYDVGAEGSPEQITVPQGAITDLASIPRPAWVLLPPDGPWTKAAVVHDFLYRTKGTCLWPAGTHKRWVVCRTLDYTRAEADGILKEAMTAVGVPRWQRLVIWAAVRVGGGKGWGS